MKFGLRETVFLVLLMVIPFGAWWFVFNPQSDRNAEMRSQIEARQAKLQQLSETLRSADDLQGQIDDITSAMDYFESKLPHEKEIDKILQEIWVLAKANNLRPDEIRCQIRGKKNLVLGANSRHSEQSIRITVDGGFRGFYAFLLALENQPRIMRIQTMKLKIPRKGPAGEINAEFEMSVFFERNQKEGSWPQKIST